MIQKILGIASVPERKNSLLQTVASVIDQVDEVIISLNGYAEVPPELNNPKIHCDLFDNSLKDSAKFYRVSEFENCYYLTLDDDLKVKSGYVDYLISGVAKYNGLVSLHGRIYLAPVTNFKKWAGNYRCLNTVSEDVKVNLIGSGCCAFHTDRLKFSICELRTPGKADVWLSKIATEQGVPMVVLKHPIGYVEYLSTPPKTTLWETTKDYSEHVRIMQSFIK